MKMDPRRKIIVGCDERFPMQKRFSNNRRDSHEFNSADEDYDEKEEAFRFSSLPVRIVLPVFLEGERKRYIYRKTMQYLR